MKESAGPGMPVDDRLLVGLRRREGVDLGELGLDAHARASLEDRWRPFLEEGLLLRRAGRWQLRDPEGMSLSNRVMLEVVLWWEEQEAAQTLS